MEKDIESFIWKITQEKLDSNPEYKKLKELKYGRFGDLHQDAFYDWSDEDGFSRVYDYEFDQFKEIVESYDQKWEALDKESKKLGNRLFHKKDYDARKYWLSYTYREARDHLAAKEKYDAMVKELGGKTLEDVEKEMKDIQVETIKQTIAENRNEPVVVDFITKALLENGELPKDISHYNLSKQTIYETIYSEARAVIREGKSAEISSIQEKLSETETTTEEEKDID